MEAELAVFRPQVVLRGLGYPLRSNMGTSLLSTLVSYGPMQMFPPLIMSHRLSWIDQLQYSCPHRGEHLPWPSTSCDCWAQSWQTRCPSPQLSELTWLVPVHILTEVMNIIPLHWQMLGELLTISLLLFCGKLRQSHGMLAEVVYLQHVQWSWSKVRGKIC